MKLICWNIRGLGRPRTINQLNNKLRALNPRILFLIETKLSSKRMEQVRRKCGFCNGIDNDNVGSKGGLSLGWKNNSLVSLKSYSKYHIDAYTHDNEIGDTWRFTGFYDNPNERFRYQSWDLLKHLSLDDDIH